jgi:hypothetical protein
LDFHVCEVIDNLRRKELRQLLDQASFNSKDTDVIDESLQSNLDVG